MKNKQYAIGIEFCKFLASLPVTKDLYSATAPDILAFLVWKDKSFFYLGIKKSPQCSCPTRLSTGTVDSLVGKLRVIFIDAGLGGDWDER